MTKFKILTNYLSQRLNDKEKNKLKIILKDFLIVFTVVSIFIYYLTSVPTAKNSLVKSFNWIFLIPIISFSILSYLNIKNIDKKISPWIKKNINKIDKLLFASIVLSLFSTVLLESSFFVSPNWITTLVIYVSSIFGSLYLIKKYLTNFTLKIDDKSPDKTINIFLFLIIVSGFILRIYKLDFLSPAGDEYRHLLAMKHYFANGFYEYGNSHLITYLIIATKKILSTNSLFWLRMPFVLSSTFSIYLFYVAGRNIFNKKIGLIAAYLFAFMPLSVGLAQYIRGYSIELTLILFTICLFHNKKMKNMFLRAFVSILFIYVLAKINHESRLTGFANILIAYIGLYIALNLLERFKDLIKFKFLFLASTFIFGICMIFQKTSYRINLDPEFRYLAIFNSFDSTTTWFFDFIPSIIILLIFFLPILIKNKPAITSLIFVNLFSIFCFIFVFELPRSYQIRYLFDLIPFFIILLSAGFFIFSKILMPKIKIKQKSLVLALLVLIIAPPFQAISNSINKKTGDFDKNSNVAFYNNSNLYQYLSEKEIPANQILVTAPWFFDYYFDEPFIENFEKSKYVKFPKTQNYEFKDRTSIFSVAGIRSESSIKETLDIINKNPQLKYIFVHIPLHTNEIKFQPEFIPSKIPKIKMINTIDYDKKFGFYVYEIQK